MDALHRYDITYDGKVIFSTSNTWEAIGAFHGITDFAKTNGQSVRFETPRNDPMEIDRCRIDGHLIIIQ